MRTKYSFLYRNSLTIVLGLLFIVAMIGQIITGLNEYNDELEKYHITEVSLLQYFLTGHFIQTTFENWESEFLQMGTYVLLTVWLRQKGSSESKKLDEEEEVDKEPNPNKKGTPWPVKKGGFILTIYKNSLSLAFGILFFISFALHASGSFKNFNEEQTFEGKSEVSFGEFMSLSRFWFESFQNWQSEFVSVISIVVLSIYLRQFGSPESKPVDASHSHTGSA